MTFGDGAIIIGFLLIVFFLFMAAWLVVDAFFIERAAEKRWKEIDQTRRSSSL